jgi:peptidyl-tRNA hydrolase
MDDAKDIYQYIVVAPLESLNPGKLGAQCAHAANMMTHWIRKYGSENQYQTLQQWKGNLGAGTCVVLQGERVDFEAAVNEVRAESADQPLGAHNFASAGIWTDPSYPFLHEGEIWTAEVTVCAWFLGPKDYLAPILSKFKLHP